MKTKYFYLLALLVIPVIACQEDEIMVFETEDSGIYFQTGSQSRLTINSETYWDSIDFSFSTVNESVKDTIKYITLKTMGKVRDYDRPVKMIVDASLSTATEGTHYSVDLSKAVIPAGASSMEFPITLHRSDDLMGENAGKKLVIMLKLEENEHFKIPFTEQKNTNVHTDDGELIMADRF